MRQPINTKRVTKRTKMIDSVALLVGIVQPFTTLPQIWMVYVSQDASQVSFFMWTGYNVASIVLLVYGIHHRLPPIIWAQVLWLVVQTPMMVSVFFFN
ncbi:MAG TPA: hypothetical protein PLZ58_04440 [Candidatus Saccharibacteria bacterium]|nr:hypothetical protein [Candidatus Saccharibacteria bacterium]HRQ07301.1 hypothetical protein [Candidatus Saccharibacteria bacterium]HRQ97815.1 hypothetical protein [Candidatus Saccharibacteria bacterium]